MDSLALQDRTIQWDSRTTELNEIFAILTEPMWFSDSYVGMIVLGAFGIEMISVCVTNEKAFYQCLNRYFKEY